MNDPPRMTEAQLRRARRLIRSLCANCNGGNCLLLDDGYEPCPCPQMLTCSVLCRYFRAAVLPADRELQAEIMADSRRRCRECRRPFVPKAKNTLYCPDALLQPLVQVLHTFLAAGIAFLCHKALLSAHKKCPRTGRETPSRAGVVWIEK